MDVPACKVISCMTSHAEQLAYAYSKADKKGSDTCVYLQMMGHSASRQVFCMYYQSLTRQS